MTADNEPEFQYQPEHIKVFSVFVAANRDLPYAFPAPHMSVYPDVPLRAYKELVAAGDLIDARTDDQRQQGTKCIFALTEQGITRAVRLFKSHELDPIAYL